MTHYLSTQPGLNLGPPYGRVNPSVSLPRDGSVVFEAEGYRQKYFGYSIRECRPLFKQYLRQELDKIIREKRK